MIFIRSNYLLYTVYLQKYSFQNAPTVEKCIIRFLLSGADIISTATYQASITGFISHLDMSAECARELMMSGVQLAKETVEGFVSDTLPAGTDIEIF